MKEECTLSPNIHERSITIQKNMVFSTYTHKRKGLFKLQELSTHEIFSEFVCFRQSFFPLQLLSVCLLLVKPLRNMPLNDDLWVCQIMITNHYNALDSSILNLCIYIKSCKSAKLMYTRNEFNVKSEKIITLLLFGSLNGSVLR